MEEHMLETSHATIHAVCKGTGSPAVFLIHGNSADSRLFKHIFDDNNLTSAHRLISVDLPGHGKSSNAPDPERSYHVTAYAEVVLEVLRQLKATQVVVFGSSMGGHVGIELLPLAARTKDVEIKGLMITGTPPSYSMEQIAESFNFDPNNDNNFIGKEILSDAEVDTIIKHGCGSEKTPSLEQMVRRTDGRARSTMVAAIRAGKGVDQREVVAEMKMPLAVVNGEDDAFVKLDVLDTLTYGNLWRGKCIRLTGTGHAPYWQKPALFLPVFADFVADCSAEL